MLDRLDAMSDSAAPGSEERPGTVPVPPAPPIPPAPPAPPSSSRPGPVYGVPPAPGPSDAPDYGSPSARPPAYAYAPPPPTAPRTLSLVGMILGIAGLVITVFAWGFGFVLSAPAVVLGVLGRRREPGARGFALAAIITGLAGIVVSLIYLAVTVVILVVAIGAANS